MSMVDACVKYQKCYFQEREKTWRIFGIDDLVDGIFVSLMQSSELFCLPVLLLKHSQRLIVKANRNFQIFQDFSKNLNKYKNFYVSSFLRIFRYLFSGSPRSRGFLFVAMPLPVKERRSFVFNRVMQFGDILPYGNSRLRCLDRRRRIHFSFVDLDEYFYERRSRPCRRYRCV